jgi:hypothetical protein
MKTSLDCPFKKVPPDQLYSTPYPALYPVTATIIDI